MKIPNRPGPPLFLMLIINHSSSSQTQFNPLNQWLNKPRILIKEFQADKHLCLCLVEKSLKRFWTFDFIWTHNKII